jgi:HEAT repeat protein
MRRSSVALLLFVAAGFLGHQETTLASAPATTDAAHTTKVTKTDHPLPSGAVRATASAPAVAGRIAAFGPKFQPDPDARLNLDNVRMVRCWDSDRIIRAKAVEVGSGDESQCLWILTVVITDSTLASWPRYSGSGPPRAAYVLREDSASVSLWYWGEGASNKPVRASLSELCSGDPAITHALDLLARSRSRHPMIIVMRRSTLFLWDEKSFNTRASWQLDDLLEHLHIETGAVHRPTAVLMSTVPNYLYSGVTNSWGAFSMAAAPNFGRLSDLVPIGSDNGSRDFFDPAGAPLGFFVNTCASAPVELVPSAVRDIAGKVVSVGPGASSISITTKRGVRVTFRGITAVNPDFLKLGSGAWGAVLGLSAPNGFTLSIRDAAANGGRTVSGEDVIRDRNHIQDRLPAGIVEMIRLAQRGPGSAIRGLRHPLPKVRLAAAQHLRANPDSVAVGPLVAALAEPDTAVQRIVIETLVAIGRPAADTLLVAVRSPDPGIATIAARLLTRLPDSRFAGRLVAALGSPYESVRTCVSDALGAIGPPAVDSLLPALASQNADIVGSAARALQSLPDPRAVGPLRAALRDMVPLYPLGEDGAARDAVIRALAAIGTPAADALLPDLGSPDSLLAVSAAGVLARIGDRRAAAPLIAMLLAPRTHAVAAAWVLAQVADTSLAQFPIAALCCQDPDVRAQAVRALADMGPPAARALRRGSAKDLERCPWPRLTLAACGDVESESLVVRRWMKREYPAASRPEILRYSRSDDFLRLLAVVERDDPDPSLRIAARACREGDDQPAWTAALDRAIRTSAWIEPTLHAMNDMLGLGQLYQYVERICFDCIDRGDDATLPGLSRILETSYGTEKLAVTYLNCGNSLLSQTATDWAHRHGYTVVRGSGGGNARWGSRRRR